MDNVTLETTLLDSAVGWLRERLPGAEIQVDRETSLDSTRADAFVHLSANSYSTRVVVELRNTVTPRTVAELTGGPFRRLRSAAYEVPVLVVAPYLSRQAQTALRAENLCYLDMAGNALIRLANPAVFIETHGATRAPRQAPTEPRRVTMRGPGAGRLIRTLVDIAPPYSVSDLSAVTGLDAGYISRTLRTLFDFGVITRAERGRVVGTDIGGLLDLWSETYAVFKSNRPFLFVAPNGPKRTLASLRGVPDVYVTGSFAASLTTKIAAPSQLLVYTSEMAALSERLNLLPTDQAADVVLLEPFDPVVWERIQRVDDVAYVAKSQIAIDCLTGGGRMPSEGTALKEWMIANEKTWRSSEITGLKQEKESA